MLDGGTELGISEEVKGEGVLYIGWLANTHLLSVLLDFYSYHAQLESSAKDNWKAIFLLRVQASMCINPWFRSIYSETRRCGQLRTLV